jgi:alkaline phosphatase
MISMKGYRFYYLLLMALYAGIFPMRGQEVKIHSHNDYQRRLPFYEAYGQLLSSVESDIFATAMPGELLVAHNASDLPAAPTLEEAYLQPILSLFKLNKGRAWRNSDRILYWLIDLKTDANPTLDYLVEKLRPHPEVFDPAVNPYAVHVIISGSLPDADRFADYPSFVTFDGSRLDYTPEQLEHISMISLNLRNYTKWNGREPLADGDYRKLSEVIEAVHAAGKPVRFWGTPDGEKAWSTFHALGVDVINTDTPAACAAYFLARQAKNP